MVRPTTIDPFFPQQFSANLIIGFGSFLVDMPKEDTPIFLSWEKKYWINNRYFDFSGKRQWAFYDEKGGRKTFSPL